MPCHPGQPAEELITQLEKRCELYAINGKATIELWTEDLQALLTQVKLASVSSKAPAAPLPSTAA